MAVALVLLATVATARAAGPTNAACSAVAIAADDAALDRGLREPLIRYPWLTKAVPICAVVATGKPAEQFATLSGCLANACVDSQGTGCQEASRSVVAALRASAAARARSTRQRQQCGPPVVDAAERTPLETHLEILQALRRGDESTVRRLSDGADSDLAITVRSAASLEAFYRAAAARQGDDVAELTRLVRAAGAVSNEFEATDFREERSGSYATVVRGNLPYPTYYRRVAGEWKSDLTRQKANMPNAAAVVPVAQLQGFA